MAAKLLTVCFPPLARGSDGQVLHSHTCHTVSTLSLETTREFGAPPEQEVLSKGIIAFADRVLSAL